MDDLKKYSMGIRIESMDEAYIEPDVDSDGEWYKAEDVDRMFGPASATLFGGPLDGRVVRRSGKHYEYHTTHYYARINVSHKHIYKWQHRSGDWIGLYHSTEVE